MSDDHRSAWSAIGLGIAGIGLVVGVPLGALFILAGFYFAVAPLQGWFPYSPRIPRKGLWIIRAMFGPPEGPWGDVTELVRGYVTDGVLRAPVDYRLLGNPSPTIGKWLTVDYAVDGTVQPSESWPEQPEPLTAVLPLGSVVI